MQLVSTMVKVISETVFAGLASFPLLSTIWSSNIDRQADLGGGVGLFPHFFERVSPVDF